MTTATPQSSGEYTKLPGRGSRFDGVRFVAGRTKTSKLWLGRDHLLEIEATGFAEDYRRFYYRDIQALVVRKTNRCRNINIGTSLGFGLFFVLGFLVYGPSTDARTGAYVCFFISALFAVPLLINSLLGPACIVHLKTEVQFEVLPSLHRMRTLKKAMALLRPRILEVQGSLSPEALQVQLAQPARPTGGISQKKVAETIKPYKGHSHQFLFCAMSVYGLFNVFEIVYHPAAMLFLDSILMLTAFCAVFIALLKQYETDLCSKLRNLTWATAIFQGVCFFISYIVGVVLQVQMQATNPPTAPNTWDNYKRIAEMPPLHTPWLLCVLIFAGVGSLASGALGLIWLKSLRQPPPAPEVQIIPPPAAGPLS